MITTEDNPFDPFDDLIRWNQFDVARGYHTLSYLARVIHTSDELSEADQLQDNEDAIDAIIREHDGQFYKKLTRELET